MNATAISGTDMAERMKIGIICTPENGWGGNLYYVKSLLSALKVLPDEQRPAITVYCPSKSVYNDIKDVSGYPLLELNRTLWRRAANAVATKLHIGGLFRSRIDNRKSKCGLFYPISAPDVIADESRALAWIPDFRDRYLPHLFSEAELKERESQIWELIDRKVPFVFGSRAAQSDFNRFYDEPKVRSFVLRATVLHPKFNHLDINKLRSEYGIQTKEYFFCANQFLRHKNHLFLFRAFKRYLDEGGQDMQLICMGVIDKFKDPDNAQRLLNFLSENGLEDRIRIIGEVPRDVMLCLMKNSRAIIQPSLFEGWSTTVEDAKRLGKHIYLSDLRIHREQDPINATYFDPENPTDLVTKLRHVKPTTFPSQYRGNVFAFAEDFMKIASNFCG